MIWFDLMMIWFDWPPSKVQFPAEERVMLVWKIWPSNNISSGDKEKQYSKTAVTHIATCAGVLYSKFEFLKQATVATVYSVHCIGFIKHSWSFVTWTAALECTMWDGTWSKDGRCVVALYIKSYCSLERRKNYERINDIPSQEFKVHYHSLNTISASPDQTLMICSLFVSSTCFQAQTAGVGEERLHTMGKYVRGPQQSQAGPHKLSVRNMRFLKSSHVWNWEELLPKYQTKNAWLISKSW